jgi:hypothetical protein
LAALAFFDESQFLILGSRQRGNDYVYSSTSQEPDVVKEPLPTPGPRHYCMPNSIGFYPKKDSSKAKREPVCKLIVAYQLR